VGDCEVVHGLVTVPDAVEAPEVVLLPGAVVVPGIVELLVEGLGAVVPGVVVQGDAPVPPLGVDPGV
jgi:hypothetical protein